MTTFNWQSGISNFNAKADFSWYPRTGHTIRFGLNTLLSQFDPGSETEERLPAVPGRQGLESALYVGHQWEINEQLALEYGLRLSRFQNLGSAKEYVFDNNYLLKDSISHPKGSYHDFWGLAPRLNLRYRLSDQSALKVSYSRTFQYQQELRNAVSSFSAFYVWLPSGPNVPAQWADQLSLGYFHQFADKEYEWSVEAYYKWLDNQVDFRDHAQLLQNPYLEGELRVGKGRAYGVEVLLQKRKGELNGWLSYTYARTLRQIPGVNEGLEYPAYYDLPHEAEIVVQYQASKRWKFSANWQYSSGKAVNLPIGSYRLDEQILPLYGARNSNRLPDFHRLDLSATLSRKDKPGQKNQSYWVFSLFNTYYRKNALSIDLLPWQEKTTGNIPDPTDVRVYKTYIFGLVPSVSYNFKF